MATEDETRNILRAAESHIVENLRSLSGRNRYGTILVKIEVYDGQARYVECTTSTREDLHKPGAQR